MLADAAASEIPRQHQLAEPNDGQPARPPCRTPDAVKSTSAASAAWSDPDRCGVCRGECAKNATSNAPKSGWNGRISNAPRSPGRTRSEALRSTRAWVLRCSLALRDGSRIALACSRVSARDLERVDQGSAAHRSTCSRSRHPLPQPAYCALGPARRRSRRRCGGSESGPGVSHGFYFYWLARALETASCRWSIPRALGAGVPAALRRAAARRDHRVRGALGIAVVVAGCGPCSRLRASSAGRLPRARREVRVAHAARVDRLLALGQAAMTHRTPRRGIRSPARRRLLRDPVDHGRLVSRPRAARARTGELAAVAHSEWRNAFVAAFDQLRPLLLILQRCARRRSRTWWRRARSACCSRSRSRAALARATEPPALLGALATVVGVALVAR